MLTNSDCTFYVKQKDNSFVRRYVPECFWQPVDATRIAPDGFVSADSIIIYIPASNASDAPVVSAKDFVVKGNCPTVNSDTSQQGISDFVRNLNEGYDMFTVTTIENRLYGRNAKHIKVIAR